MNTNVSKHDLNYFWSQTTARHHLCDDKKSGGFVVVALGVRTPSPTLLTAASEFNRFSCHSACKIKTALLRLLPRGEYSSHVWSRLWAPVRKEVTWGPDVPGQGPKSDQIHPCIATVRALRCLTVSRAQVGYCRKAQGLGCFPGVMSNSSPSPGQCFTFSLPYSVAWCVT